MVYPEPGFELHQRQGDTSYAQMFTDVGVYYAPAAVLRGEEFNGAEAVHRLEQWLIENHGYQPQYAVSELSERDFWRMFDASHYTHCRRKYGAVGTLMSVYYKSKKGKKTEKEVQEAEAAIWSLRMLRRPDVMMHSICIYGCVYIRENLVEKVTSDIIECCNTFRLFVVNIVLL